MASFQSARYCCNKFFSWQSQFIEQKVDGNGAANGNLVEWASGYD
jgi:hypothetical protein